MRHFAPRMQMRFPISLAFALAILSGFPVLAQTNLIPVLPVVTSVDSIPHLKRLFEEHSSQAQISSNIQPVSRPLLFVHGCGSNYFDWYRYSNSPVIPLRDAAMRDFPDLYRTDKIYVVWFDGVRVRFADTSSGTEVAASQVSQGARFFIIALYDPTQVGFSAATDPNNVNQITIAYKAVEVATVIAAIQSLTYVADLTVLTHSMGGLVARTYIEGLGFSGLVPYQNNIGALITLDAPHSGAESTVLESIGDILGSVPCNGLNRQEIDNSGTLIPTLNYQVGSSFGGIFPEPIPSSVSIASIKSYNTDLFVVGTPSDGALTSTTQDMRLALRGNFPVTNNFSSVENSFGTTRFSDPACNPVIFIYLLHPLLCVGVQPQTIQLLYDEILAYQPGVPIGVNDLSLAGSVNGGTGATGTITLTTGAPPHGAVVALSSDDPSIQVPANINIAAGIDTATFDITSTVVNVPTSVHITASYGRGTQQASVMVQPASSQVSLTAASLNFNTQLVHRRSDGQVLSVSNSGNIPLVISSIVASGDFQQANSCIGTIAVGASCAIDAVFTPTSTGPANGTLTITDNAPGSPHVVTLTGTGFDILISFARPHRSSRAGPPIAGAQRDSVVLSVVGATPSAIVQVSCAGSSGETCTTSQKVTGNILRVDIHVSQRRSARLRASGYKRQTVNLIVAAKNATKTFSIPVQF